MLRTSFLAIGVTVLFVVPAASAQSGRDTLPENVVRKSTTAWTHKDLHGAFVGFDTAWVQEYLGDGKGPHRVRLPDQLAQTVKDSAHYPALTKDWRAVRVQRSVAGPWVYEILTFKGQKGEQFRHIQLFEVRHGKIVRELDGDA